MSVKVTKIGVNFSGPSLVLLYEFGGVTRKRDMPLRDLNRDSDCSAIVKRLKLRHSKYLESVSDIKLEKLILLARENKRGNTLQDGLENVKKELQIDPDQDLNKLGDKDLKRQKQIMDLTFDKNSIGKDHPDFIYDKQVQFQPASGVKADWDDDSSEEERSETDLIEAPKETNDSADDFW